MRFYKPFPTFVGQTNPMCLVHFEELGLYIYASTESIMSKALKKIGFNKLQCYRIELSEGDIIRIENNGNISCSKFELQDDFRFGKWYDWYNSFDDNELYNDHEQMLLEICSCYGIDEDDVILLLDYGYSCDDIEDMLMDQRSLFQTLSDIKHYDLYSGIV